WARPIRPTTTRIRSATTVDVHEVDPRAAAAGDGRRDGADRRGRTTLAADDLAEVVRVHANLEQLALAGLLGANRDLVGVLDDAGDEVLDDLLHGSGHDQASSAFVSSAGVSSALGSSALGSSAGASAAFSSALSFLA